MSFERSYSIESHERIKLILIFADKSLLLKWWVTYLIAISNIIIFIIIIIIITTICIIIIIIISSNIIWILNSYSHHTAVSVFYRITKIPDGFLKALETFRKKERKRKKSSCSIFKLSQPLYDYKHSMNRWSQVIIGVESNHVAATQSAHHTLHIN